MTDSRPVDNRSAPVRRRRRLVAAVCGVLLPGASLVAGMGWLLADTQPTVPSNASITVDDVERALLLARAHDPRRAIPGVVRTLRLSQHEAELLLHHAAARLRPGRWKLAVSAERLQLQASLRLPDNPFGSWLNLDLRAHQTATLPRLDALTVGRLPLPLPLVEWAIDRTAARYGVGDWRALAAVAVQQVRLHPQRIDVVYAWGPDAPSRLLAALVPQREHERMRVYAARLAQLAGQVPAGRPLALSQLLPPLFELARRRSAGGPAAALENRAALLVLGMVANGVSLAALLPERHAELAARRIRLTLAGRRDFPQHFLVSAALAAESGGPLAELLGLYKELADARSGSGFSFNDMALNRAGTRLGELAVVAPAQLQDRLSAGLLETDLVPDLSDLPEFLSQREFRRRFGAPGSPAFESIMSDIEQRLGTTPLYR